MHNEFKITLDKVDSEAYPEFLDGEVDYYLNEAQDRFIKTRYGGNNLYKAGFEENQKRTDDLKAVTRSRYTTVSLVPYYNSAGYNVFRADLGSLFEDDDLNVSSNIEYMLYLKSLTKICFTNAQNKECCGWHEVKLVQQDDLSRVASDPFNKPKPSRPIIFFEDSDVFIWTSSNATVEGFLVTFIKQPEDINLGTYGGTTQDCELSEHTHKEIVQLAVRIALENIESPRQQSQEVLNVRKME